MANTIGTAYIQIEPTAEGISGKIEKELGGAGAAGGTAFSKGFGSVIGGVGKVVAGSVAVGTAAVGAFAKSSVEAGATFDSSMAQVAATMGTTVDQIGELRDFAQQMGSTTAFSATEAADALNYMALAGYDAETSMNMLPNVLNLAAAGGIELATASDMITDAQTALGLSLDETSTMVDQMAKASSKSNTSVAQLGDAFLKIGANARNVKGGTQELSTVLGVLADNGIKGSEAGTHLRNIMLALNPTTDKAVAMWDELGVSAYDANGKLRELPDVFQDLNFAMKDMTDQEKTEAFSAMFNKTDLAAIQALVGTTGERFNELSAAIGNASGAADDMAKTQLDNLAGDVTLFKSALEGAQIAVSDQLTPTLREFVQFGADGLSQLTQSFKEGGLEGAMSTFGDLLSQLLTKITGMLPDLVHAGMELLGALGQGILDNLDVVIDAAVQIINEIVVGLIQALPALVEGAMQILTGLVTGLIQLLPTVIPQLIEGLTAALPLLIQGLIQLNVALANALPEIIVALIDALPDMITQIVDALMTSLPILIDGTTQLVIALAAHLPEIIMALIEAIPQLIMQIGNAIVTSAPELIKSVVTLMTTIVEQVRSLWESFKANVNTKLQEFSANFKTWLAQLPEQVAYWVGALVAKFVSLMYELPFKIAQILTQLILKVQEFGRNLVEKGHQMVTDFKNRFIEGFDELPEKMLNVGHNIVEGLINGIKNAWGNLKEFVGGLVDNLVSGFTDNLKIGSPSKVFRDEVGRWIPAGLAEGIESGIGTLNSSMEDMTMAVSPSNVAGMSVYTPSSGVASDGTSGQALYDLLSRYLPLLENQTNVNVSLEGDAQGLFNAVRNQNKIYRRMNGESAFA